MKTWLFTAVFPGALAIDFECDAPDRKTARRIAREWHPGATISEPRDVSRAAGSQEEGFCTMCHDDGEPCSWCNPRAVDSQPRGDS